MIYFLVIELVGLMILLGGYTNYLFVLLSFEMMFYGVFFLFMVLGLLVVDLMSFLFLLIMIVCGSCYGLCLLVVLGRSMGSDMCFI